MPPVGGGEKGRVGDPLREAVAAAQVQQQVFNSANVLRGAEVLITQTVIQNKAWRGLEAVLHISEELIVTVLTVVLRDRTSGLVACLSNQKQ